MNKIRVSLKNRGKCLLETAITFKVSAFEVKKGSQKLMDFKIEGHFDLLKELLSETNTFYSELERIYAKDILNQLKRLESKLHLTNGVVQ